MKKTSGLSFAVWINWIFFSLFMLFAFGAAWAIYDQQNAARAAKIEALLILLFAVVLPAVIFMINAIILRKISTDDPVISTR
jgi:hypothetical protein